MNFWGVAQIFDKITAGGGVKTLWNKLAGGYLTLGSISFFYFLKFFKENLGGVCYFILPPPVCTINDKVRLG